MTIPSLPFKFPDFVKYPLHAVVYLLLIYFVYKEFTKSDDCAELRKIIISQEARISKLEADKDNLTTSLLVKNGIIDGIKKATDSVVREKIGNEAIKILNK
jgi:hypothetical protein